MWLKELLPNQRGKSDAEGIWRKNVCNLQNETEKASGLQSDWLKVYKCWVFGLKFNLLHKHFIIAVSPPVCSNFVKLPPRGSLLQPPPSSCFQLRVYMKLNAVGWQRACWWGGKGPRREPSNPGMSHGDATQPSCPPTASTAGHAGRPAGGFLQHAGP